MSKEQEMLNKIKNEVGIVSPMHEWTPPPIKKKYRLIIDLETTDIASMDYKIRQLLGFQEVLNVDIEDIFLR